MMKIKVTKLYPDAQLPQKATAGSAGWDLYARLDAPVVLVAESRQKISAGIAIELAEGTVGLLFGRSGLGSNYGVTLSNAVGVIDSDYRGEIIVSLSNLSGEDYTIHPNDRIAQLVVMQLPEMELEETDTLEGTSRAAGGFGSTGR